jgi:hypothetical protein
VGVPLGSAKGRDVGRDVHVSNKILVELELTTATRTMALTLGLGLQIPIVGYFAWSLLDNFEVRTANANKHYITSL